MKNVVLYTRVSTDEQAKSGHSLEFQLERLKKYCEFKGLNILEEFQEDYSAKNFERPAWKSLHAYAKSNRKNIDQILVLKWDRFSRNVEQSYSVIRVFKEMGIEINAIEQPLDMRIPESKATLAFYLVLPEIDNDRRSMSIRDGNYMALRMGYFINKAPYGYTNIQIKVGDKTKGTLEVVPEQANYIKEAFERISTGIESANAVRLNLKARGMKMSKSNFLRALRKVVYMGKILVPEYKGEPEMIVEGKHQGITDAITFKKVQDVLDGKRWNGVKPSHRNEVFPLRNFLQCDCCDTNVTASSSKGRNGLHHYYHCKHGTRIKRARVHGMFSELLDQMTISKNVKDLYKSILNDAASIEKKEQLNRLRAIGREIIQTQEEIDSIDMKFAKNDIDKERYNRIIGKLEGQLISLKIEEEELKDSPAPVRSYIENSVELLSNLSSIYENSSYDNKRVLVGSIFPEKIRLSKSKCRTTELNQVVELLCRNNGHFEGTKKGTNSEKSDLSPSVLEAGIHNS